MSLPSTSYANHGELDAEKSQFLRESYKIQDGVKARFGSAQSHRPTAFMLVDCLPPGVERLRYRNGASLIRLTRPTRPMSRRT